MPNYEPLESSKDQVDMTLPQVQELVTLARKTGGLLVAETFENWPELRWPDVTTEFPDEGDEERYFMVMLTDHDWCFGWGPPHELVHMHTAHLPKAGLSDGIEYDSTEHAAELLFIMATIQENQT